jgi:tyrosyl-tRNA synthetase
MQSKLALARRLVAQFYEVGSADAAETEWRRIHQRRQLPTEMPIKTLTPQTLRASQLLVSVGEASSNSEAVRLVRQRALKINGTVVETPAQEISVVPGVEIVVQVGPKRFVKVRGE